MEKDFAYDALPYSNHLFMQTHPNRLATLGTLFGMKPPAVEKSRVLELGCGNGMNLIAQAFVLPEAEFVGIDLAKTHIDYAENSARELNLSNVKFQQFDLMDMSAAEFGKFDYIIAHGLISWIPEPVRAKVFSIYREMLSENGVGFISYNTYPGWYHRQTARGIGRIHTRNIDNPLAKVESALEFIKFLGENTPRNDVYKFILNNELFSFADVEPTSIFHDNLAEINEPYYFYEFAGRLEENGLQFLAEAELFTMSAQSVPPAARKFIETIDDIIWREQYLDFLTGRVFRQTLFCHKEIKLNHKPPPSILDEFRMASMVKPDSEKPEIHTDKVERFAGIGERGIEINHPLTKAALIYLGKIWDNSVSFPELLQKARMMLGERGFRTNNWEEDFQVIRDVMLQLIQNSEFIEIFTYHPKIYTEIDEKPKINPLARWQLDKSNLILAGYDKTFKIDDPLMKRLLELSDGTRTQENIYEELRNFIQTNQEYTDKETALKGLEDNFHKDLTQFARAGLFVP
ncbi:MAG TPA: class I SAM-dependent methyltransferase [Pyrinomonadaceae bacterium]|nr:class I SAM-dependent methyltransferase [Pyrinomonadaceae bacterium]